MAPKNQYIVNYSVGPDAYMDIASVCAPYGKKVVIIGGKRAFLAAEHYIEAALKNTDITSTGFLWYGGEAAIEYAENLISKEEFKEADMVFAVGGGKAIDTSKYAAMLAEKPVFTFPTIAATCAAASAEAIMYYTNGVTRGTYEIHKTPIHVFINTQIIADAPDLYLWAGIGDTMAKHFETSLAVRGRTDTTFAQDLGVAIGEMCYKPLIMFGEKAINDCKLNFVSPEFEKIVLTNIITTGIVSCHVGVTINANIAHAICYGMTMLPQIEKRHLHGEVVSYCTLVLLVIDNQLDKIKELFPLYKAIKLPTKLADLEVTEEELKPVIEKALSVDDIKYVPYEVTYTMINKAIKSLEEYNKSL